MSDKSCEEEEIEVIYEVPEDLSSEEPSMSEWSSLEFVRIKQTENEKKALYEQGLYSPGSSDICPKYIAQSDSVVVRHPYYNYPAVQDPGIEQALLAPEIPIVYPDDGQALYLYLCSEMNQTPVRIFHKQLLDSEMNLSYYGVNPKGVRAMAIALKFNKNVRVFNLTENFLTDDSCFHLGEMLKTNSTLQELNLTGCRIGLSGLINLGADLHINRTLLTLNLARNKIGDEGGAHFAKLISEGVTIPKVILSSNELGRQTALAFMEVLEWRDPFIILDLSWNTFVHTPSTVKMLSQLGCSRILQQINLAFNALEGTRVAGAIFDLLNIPTLKVLDLSHNRLQGEAIDIIISGLINAKKLVTLNLSFNPMSPEDAYNVLQKMLRPKVKLQNLLMESVSVLKPFLALVEKISKMKFRKNFKVVYGDVLHNWTITGPDARSVILKRVEYLGSGQKKKKVDILVYFLTLFEQNSGPILPKTLLDNLIADGIPLNEDCVNQLAEVFPGPKVRKFRTIDFYSVCEYIHRVWPDKKPIVPEPEVEIPPEPKEEQPPAKTKKNKK